jgi:hypothetical protein
MDKHLPTQSHTHAHAHTHTHIYIYVCVCVCVCVLIDRQKYKKLNVYEVVHTKLLTITLQVLKGQEGTML